MKVVLDNVIFELQKSGGISVVWYELIRRLQQVEGLDLYFLDNQSSYNYYRQRLSLDTHRILSPAVTNRLSRYQVVDIKMDEPFIFHSSYYRYCTNKYAVNVTTVHDFTYEFFLKGLKQRLHSWQKFRAIRHSNGIACISKNTKTDLLSLLPTIQDKKISVIYNGVSDEYFPLSKDDAHELSIPFFPRSYVIFIGKRDIWKNFSLAIRGVAFSDYNLLIVGSSLSASEQTEINRYMPTSRYKRIDFVSNEKLNILLNHAVALVYPSSYEGFGLPVLEAQRAGCPVIAYNSSSIPEVIGSTPLLLNELSEVELADKLKLLKQQSKVEEIRRQGLHNAQHFSWDKMAVQYLNLYRSLLQS